MDTERYSRHILLPEVGSVGQQKLLDSKVLIVGAGGLGSPAALYLAAAGVGTIGIADGDEVDVTNLQRQVLYSTHQIGSLKTNAASARLRDLNPDVVVLKHPDVTPKNVIPIMREYDFVIDGSDNFNTKYLLNDTAMVETGTPISIAGIRRFQGQTMTIVPGPECACYRCVCCCPPPQGTSPHCAAVGVLGVLPGVIGTIQATEAIKCLLGFGTLLTNTMLIYNALEMDFCKVKVAKSPSCKCGTNPLCPVCGAEPWADCGCNR